MQSDSWARKSKIQGDFRFDVVNMIVLGLITLLFFYPMYLCLISAVSSPEEVYAGRVLLLPKGFNSEGFQRVIENDSLWRGYLNTIFYTVLGTCINLALTMTGAFVLSRRTFALRTPLNWMVLFTMFFGGGMIPTYLLVKDLKLLNTVWSLVLPGAISTWNLIITRTFLATSIPNELQEAAYIDGCNNIRFFLRIVLPNATTIIAVIGLFYAVDHWLSYWNAMLYITDETRYPLQLVLRDILLKAEVALESARSGEDSESAMAVVELLRISESVKYIVVIAGTLPLLIVFPFVEKYFVKGVMIGSVKG
ncbi:MAG TPA: carbohydrate ABC transporter permease [Candidatus Ornithocaccomicrobium faecavium]|uniref:Carbohydrate ABC transporter permease n=1 Tax=Candidatus Ornithocaccomicrobium faecavium TaxID=2840890 RepID=A0A9D1P5R3_9FIRM|nr:carbohydrate ABC transporter permease [Candidatus Ornithocaccomicrobium faecavium]